MDCLQYDYSSDEEDSNQKSNRNTNENDYRQGTETTVKTVNATAKRIVANPAPRPTTLATLQYSYHTKNHGYNATASNGSTGSKVLMNNPLKSHLFEPIQGPQIPSNAAAAATTNSNLSQGQIATNVQHNMTFDQSTFEIQRNDFQRNGIALGPNEDNAIYYGGDNDSGMGMGMVVKRTNYGHARKKFNKETNQYEEVQVHDDRFANDNHDNINVDNNNNGKKRKRKKNIHHDDQELIHDSDDELNYGIWGPPTHEMKQIQNDTLSTLQKVNAGIIDSLPIEMQKEREYLKERDRQRAALNGTTVDDDNEAIASRENQNFDKLVERKMAHLLPPRIHGEEAKAIEPSTKLHLKPEEEYNYKNESWIVPPTELRNGATFGDIEHHTCYVPKKCTGRFLGHNKGVHRIRLFPNTGHLLLSGGLDGKCKVWNVLTKQVCRTYIGHSAAVRDVQFNNDGSQFLSCSFDRFIRLWDTESGKVLGTFTNRRVPYIIKFYPLDDTIFVVGCSDNKIVAYDSNTGEITQEYNHHLAPVNTITFVEDHGMKMITSSDDKKILIWEWDIGVPIKYISDPTMHSIPVVTLHPSGAFFAGQSLDNQIVVYQGKDRFALQKKKKFSGHLVSGYACDIAISPDGQFICSGDGNGKLFFWDWKRSRILQKYHAHDKGPAIGCVWHPTLPSTVFTCGWDGVIKMWE